jgi:hypothetical protein
VPVPPVPTERIREIQAGISGEDHKDDISSINISDKKNPFPDSGGNRLGVPLWIVRGAAEEDGRSDSLQTV